jgi:hypothetical protein
MQQERIKRLASHGEFMTVPNLKELFRDRYRLTYDPAAATWGERLDPWMHQIPCLNGVIYCHGDGKLGVECLGQTAKKLLAIEGTKLHQQGSTEWTVVFPLELFEQVALIVKPRKRRTLSPERKAKLMEASKEHRFGHA